ncbi:mycothiol-dependent nitroreductase Rv2466c family protein [Brachybacterium huguangmaarense]
MRISFAYDPSCPFSWITSRWLLEVAGERDIDITLVPFSLAMKNDELDGETDPHGMSHRRAHRVLRVITAAEKAGASPVDLYSAFGAARHIDGREYDDALILEVLDRAGLSGELLAAADDTSFDDHLREQQQSVLDVVGGDTGVPTILFHDEGGATTGYFGPVLNAMPSREEGLAIWDGLSRLAPVSSFYELKRTRTGAPDVQSTKGR